MMRIFVLIGAILFLAPALHAEVILSGRGQALAVPVDNQTVIASFGFENEDVSAGLFVRHGCA